MAYELMKLPFGMSDLEPHMSKETLEYHYGKHHQTYVTKLNGLVEKTEFSGLSLEEVIKRSANSHPTVFNNAAQIYNHDFFWNSLTPKGSSITDDVSQALKESFGSYEKFEEEFKNKATALFGSGWAWLVKTSEGLEIQTHSNAGTPITQNQKPLLVCDVWEHAYYIDHRNQRPKFLESFFKLINWNFVSENLEK